MKILKSIINWIFPKKCISCGREITEDSILCPDCFKNTIFIDFPYCRCCGKLLQSSYNEEHLCNICLSIDRHFDMCRSLFLYSQKTRKIVMRIKKEADESVAKICAELICKRYAYLVDNVDVIVPVPLHITRLLTRGFNQAEIIAKHISKITDIPMNTKILKRIKKTESQKNKTIGERIENISGAFKVISDISNKRILVVDDVMTTGATLSECSKTLKESGAQSVYCVTIMST